jgi:hypothetical protein
MDRRFESLTIFEFVYRFNRSFMKGNIFDNLIFRMVKVKPCTYKMIND